MLTFFFFLKYNCCWQWRATWSSGPSPVPVAGVRSMVAVSATFQGSCPGLKLRWLRLSCSCWLDCWIRFDFTLWPSSLQRNCLSMGANLASVHSMEEYYQLQWLVVNVARRQRETWIGGSDAQQVCYTLMQLFRCFVWDSLCAWRPSRREFGCGAMERLSASPTGAEENPTTTAGASTACKSTIQVISVFIEHKWIKWPMKIWEKRRNGCKASLVLINSHVMVCAALTDSSVCC